MDKFDYITATIEEEKVRVEKIIKYLKENNLVDELPEYQEREKLDNIRADSYVLAANLGR